MVVDLERPRVITQYEKQFELCQMALLVSQEKLEEVHVSPGELTSQTWKEDAEQTLHILWYHFQKLLHTLSAIEEFRPHFPLIEQSFHAVKTAVILFLTGIEKKRSLWIEFAIQELNRSDDFLTRALEEFLNHPPAKAN